MKFVIFGATGNVGSAATERAIANGHEVTVLVRTPSKLDPVLAKKLVVIKGDAVNASDVEKALTNQDVLLFALGAKPGLKWYGFDNDPADFCEKAMEIIKNVYREKHKSKLPSRIIAVSTTGLKKGMLDVPLLFRPLYAIILHYPHIDKKKMEQQLGLIGEAKDKIIVRPALFVPGQPTEEIKSGKDANGYLVAPASVGWYISDHFLEEGIFGPEIRLSN